MCVYSVHVACMYVCAYMYMYAYVCVYMWHIHMYMCVYIYVYMCVYMWRVHVHVHICSVHSAYESNNVMCMCMYIVYASTCMYASCGGGRIEALKVKASTTTAIKPYLCNKNIYKRHSNQLHGDLHHSERTQVICNHIHY